ncbi:hypothetical protein [Hoeflea sp. TYP-13]|uniref:hypothetical protein n=1 Tax=Hoeflea sp. TYP-13 TaxID=3230023 RepID=UPI0034C687A7
MFDTEFYFEELPILIGKTEIAMCTGTALLEGEYDCHDYGFFVTGIALDGNLDGSYRDKRRVRISAASDDPFCALLFRRIADRIEADSAAADHFYHALKNRLSDVA